MLSLWVAAGLIYERFLLTMQSQLDELHSAYSSKGIFYFCFFLQQGIPS